MKRINTEFVLAGLIIIASTLFGICFTRHLCMDGHGAHPPYATREWVLDCTWIALLGAVAIHGFFRCRDNRLLIVGSVIFVCASRLVVGSGGGLLLWIEASLLSGLFVLFAAKQKLAAHALPGRSGQIGRRLFMVGCGAGVVIGICDYGNLYALLGAGLIGVGLTIIWRRNT